LGASTSRGPADLPKRIRGEASTSDATDVAELDVLYHDLPSYQPEPAGGVKEAEETVATEPISLPTKSVDEMLLVSLTLPTLAPIGLTYWAEDNYQPYVSDFGCRASSL